jgi:hypothetical protein
MKVIYQYFAAMEKKSESQRIPSWLQNLQENSWELELLISGGAVF